MMKRRNFLLTPLAMALVGKSEAVDKIVKKRCLLPVGWDGAADVVIAGISDLQVAIDNANTSSGMYIIEIQK